MDRIPDGGMTVDEFARNLRLIAGGQWQPTETQLRLLREMQPVPLTRRQRFAKRLRPTLRFLEEVGFTVLALPRTGPEFAKDFWHELRNGGEPAWMALGWGFVAACALGSVALLASAASH